MLLIGGELLQRLVREKLNDLFGDTARVDFVLASLAVP